MIILTGASGGLGKYIFQNQSKKEFIIGLINKSPLKVVKNSLIYKVNLKDEVEITNFVNNNKHTLKKITLIHMATISIDGLIHSYSTDDFINTIQSNLISNFMLTKKLLPIMISQKWGRIINISSIMSDGEVGAGAYAATKSALVGYNNTLAKEYGRFNITSNIVRLGFFEEGLINSFTKEKADEIRSKIPSKKFGQMEEILKIINYIQSSNYLNGATINLDGGI